MQLVRAAVLFTLMLAARPASAEDLSSEIKNMSWIGFQQFRDVSRVFVRTTESVKFRIDDTGTHRVVLILENTRVPLRNNTLPLDTQFFDGPVLAITPKVIEGPSQTVRIEIKLRDKVPYNQVQNDNFLAIDFRRN